MYLLTHAVDYSGSVVDGPGVRAVVFVQGCMQRCEGCHNPETLDLHAGIRLPVEELIDELRAKVSNRKVTISGGEPLLQPEAVLALVKGLPEFSFALYTGLEYEDVPDELLRRLDFLKVGRFELQKRSTTVPFVGSANQRMIKLSRRAA